eukprot:CAMPEP_0181442818 /NCGR_PEP_ID=MMETSP1110-20121109/24227_1 /TAXON_ID=174948 /ORGANISM="Symbiodinium sp., Strain CCMP421" /LENGTH=65 /DNA_ID=CAMNT_0023566761 /DNA_START=74 /DNA_END=271 /DNA_ORIENTATION=-
MAAELKAEIEALVAKISDKAAGQSSLESLGAIAKDGKKKQTLTDEEVWELEDKLNKLKESLKGKE